MFLTPEVIIYCIYDDSSLQRLDWKAITDPITHNEFCRHALKKNKLAYYRLKGFSSLTLFLWLYTLLKLIAMKCLIRNVLSPKTILIFKMFFSSSATAVECEIEGIFLSFPEQL